MASDSFRPDSDMEFRAQIQLSSWPATFEDAKQILEIARQHPDKSRLLCACACIVMAAALDQAVWAKLVYATQNWLDPKDLSGSYAGLLDREGTFKDRVDAVPKVLTNGRLQLDTNNQHIKSLYQLIRLRNALVHIRDGMKEFTVDITRDALGSWMGALPFTTNDVAAQYLWNRVSLEDAEAFKEAVGLYLRDVIDAEEIKPGQIIKEVSR